MCSKVISNQKSRGKWLVSAKHLGPQISSQKKTPSKTTRQAMMILINHCSLLACWPIQYIYFWSITHWPILPWLINIFKPGPGHPLEPCRFEGNGQLANPWIRLHVLHVFLSTWNLPQCIWAWRLIYPNLAVPYFGSFFQLLGEFRHSNSFNNSPSVVTLTIPSAGT